MSKQLGPGTTNSEGVLEMSSLKHWNGRSNSSAHSRTRFPRLPRVIDGRCSTAFPFRCTIVLSET